MGWKDDEEAVEARDGVCSMVVMFGNGFSDIGSFCPGSKIEHRLAYTNNVLGGAINGRFNCFGANLNE